MKKNAALVRTPKTNTKPAVDTVLALRINVALFEPKSQQAQETVFVNQMIALYNSNATKDFTLKSMEDDG